MNLFLDSSALAKRYVQKRHVRATRESERFEDFLAALPLVFPYSPQDGVQSSDAQGVMGRNCNPLMERFRSLQDDVATLLVDHSISPPPAKELDKILSAQIAWNFHPLAKTSSRTKWRRMAEGGCGRSK